MLYRILITADGEEIELLTRQPSPAEALEYAYGCLIGPRPRKLHIRIMRG